MTRGRWMLLAGSAVLAAAVAAMATREGVRSPEEELRGIQERLTRGRIDRDDALTDLDRLVDRTLETGDPAFVARLRRARSRLLMDIAAWDRAREDLRVALGLGALSDVERDEAEDDLIRLYVRGEDYENGLNLVKSLLDRNPRDASAWMRSGDIHRAKAEIPLADARGLIESRLVADEALDAEAELARLAAMDPADPRRPAASHGLMARFEIGDEDRAQRILRLADAAARENAQARAAYATSLALKDPRADPGRAIASLIELLQAAGRLEDAAEIGTCGLRMMQARGDASSIGLFVDVLEELGRTGYACEVGGRLVRMNGPVAPGRLLELTKLFYANERWPELGIATNRLLQVGTTAETEAAAYYAAMAQVNQGQFASGLQGLQRFLAGPSVEPFEGARAEGWRTVAVAARRLRMADLETEALDAAIQLDRAGSGEEMLRLANILAVSARGGYRRPEMQVAQAMDTMPERTVELLPLWHQYGKQELEESDRSLSDVLTNESWSRVFSGASNSSAYELFTVSRVLLHRGQTGRAEFYVRQLNALFPRFVPGIDLWIKTMHRLQRWKELEEALLLRMRLAGVDAATREVLATLPPRSLTDDRRVEFMAGDPEGFGRRMIARGFLARGRPDLALELLRPKGGEKKPGEEADPNTLPEAREIAAAALIELGRPQDAFRTLESLGGRATSTSYALELYVRSALQAGRRKSLENATKRVSRSFLPRRAAWMKLVETMLAHGAAEAAMPIVRRLDASPRTRGGDVLISLAWAQLQLGAREGLLQTLERANAFEMAGEVELVALVAAVDDPANEDLGDAIARLKGSGWEPNRLQRAALHLLQGETKAARAVIDAALAIRPEDPSWVLANALARSGEPSPPDLPRSYGPDAGVETLRFLAWDHRIDPRLFACILLVQDDPRAVGWLEGRIRERLVADADVGGGLWDHWLMALFSRARGDVAIERSRLEHLVSLRPGFGPAWDRLEEIATASRVPGRGLVEFRERKLHARGLRAGTEAERCLDIARIQRRDGDVEGALASLTRAREIDPELPGLALELGRVHRDRGEWAEAVRAFADAGREKGAAGALESTGELIHALAIAGQVVPNALALQDRAVELEALAKRVPDDARVPVALAQIDLERDPRNPQIAVARGHARLQKFLNQHKGETLESLGAGASEAWTDYLIELDPERAWKILSQDRQRDPSAIEPWVQLGRIRAARPARERFDEEIEEADELEVARRMAPIAPVLAAHARVRLAASPRLPEAMRIARDVPASLGATEPDPDLAVRLARAYFGIGPNGLVPALAILNKLAWTEDLPPNLAVEAELLRAEVSVTRGDAARAARILAEISPRIVDPYRATVALATASLAERMEEP